MRINTDFYGGADKTVTGGGGTEWTSYYLLDALNDGTLPLNQELDRSISPWAINKNADIVNICYPLSHRVGDSGYNFATPKFYPIHDASENNIPFYFCTPYYSGNYGGNFYWDARNGYGQEIIPESTNISFRDKVQILRGFDYDKFAIYPQLYYANYEYSVGMSNSNFGDVTFSEINTYFSHDDTWINEHPVIGLTFVAYYKGYDGGAGYNEIPVMMNTLGKQIPCTLSESAGNGYTVPFIDNFITLVHSGLSLGAYGYQYGGNGWIPIHDGSQWVQSYADDVSAVLGTSYSNRPIAHVPANERNVNSKWTVNAIWDGSPVYYRTELQLSAFIDAAAMKDYILKQVAYIGTWFFTESTARSETAGSSDKWYLGEIDATGVTTGNYKQGSATAEYSNATWENPWESSPYNPYSKIYIGDTLVKSIYLGDTLLTDIFCGDQEIL